MPRVIRVSVEHTEPLRGTAATEDEAPVAFEGWLEFLGAVSKLLGLPSGDAGGPDTSPSEKPRERSNGSS